MGHSPFGESPWTNHILLFLANRKGSASCFFFIRLPRMKNEAVADEASRFEGVSVSAQWHCRRPELGWSVFQEVNHDKTQRHRRPANFDLVSGLPFIGRLIRTIVWFFIGFNRLQMKRVPSSENFRIFQFLLFSMSFRLRSVVFFVASKVACALDTLGARNGIHPQL